MFSQIILTIPGLEPKMEMYFLKYYLRTALPLNSSPGNILQLYANPSVMRLPKYGLKIHWK